MVCVQMGKQQQLVQFEQVKVEPNQANRQQLITGRCLNPNTKMRAHKGFKEDRIPYQVNHAFAVIAAHCTRQGPPRHLSVRREIH